MCEEEYPDGYYRKFGELIPMVGGPSLRQFLYWYDKEYNKKKKVAAKFGQRKAEMLARSLLKSANGDLQGPGALYETDSTPADDILVSLDHKTIIGRPHVYFVKDVINRLITGMHICKTPSWEEEMVALENASTDKVSYCAQFGITINKEDWPAKHLPRYIVGDRGEMKSKNSNNLALLNIRVGNPPSYRADLKPYIEQQFKSFCMRMRELDPGGIHKEHRVRGDKNPEEKAAYTFEAYTKLVILFVLEYNRKALSEDFLVSKEMFVDNVELTPLSMWNWGMQYNLLQEQPRSLIRYALLPKETCKVTRGGVVLRKMSYACQRGEDEGWFEDEMIEGRREVIVSYDPRNCSSVFIKLANGKEEQLFLTEKFKEYEGLHFEDVKEIMSFKSKQLKKAKNNRNQIEAELDTVAKNLTQVEVAKLKEAQKGRPKSAKFKNKRSVRKLERRIESSAKAWTATKSQARVIAATATVDNQTPVIEKRKLDKMELFLLGKNLERGS
ncbi:Mu transposase C-terminal domain-containing protein [Paenibacillus donghaensis]|nr:Mu transposase C-terminal domain-containing protein [Paenibacillus donghaensis]